MQLLRCSGCNWQALVARRRRRGSVTLGGRVRRLLGRKLPLVGVVAAVLSGLAVACGVLIAGWLAAAPAPALAAGESFDGRPLAAAHPLLAAAAAADPATPRLALRDGCAWGKPGRNPYRGTVEQALRAAALPAEVVADIAAQMRAGKGGEALEIGNDGIRAPASGRVFSARNLAMTYGLSLCTRTRVNFQPGHVEPAALFESRDAQGRRYAVMVPEVCGNVSVIGQDADDNETLSIESGSVELPAPLQWGGSSDPGGASLVHRGSYPVSEPGTLACALVALGALLLLRRRPSSRRQHPQSGA